MSQRRTTIINVPIPARYRKSYISCKNETLCQHFQKSLWDFERKRKLLKRRSCRVFIMKFILLRLPVYYAVLSWENPSVTKPCVC